MKTNERVNATQKDAEAQEESHERQPDGLEESKKKMKKQKKKTMMTDQKQRRDERKRNWSNSLRTRNEENEGRGQAAKNEAKTR